MIFIIGIVLIVIFFLVLPIVLDWDWAPITPVIALGASLSLFLTCVAFGEANSTETPIETVESPVEIVYIPVDYADYVVKDGKTQEKVFDYTILDEDVDQYYLREITYNVDYGIWFPFDDEITRQYLIRPIPWEVN